MTLIHYLCFAAAAGAAGYAWNEARRIEITETEIPCGRLPVEFDGYTILHLSDFHFRQRTYFAELIVSALSSVKADLVAVTGDVTYKASGLPSVEMMLSAIKRNLPKAPIFACTGNGEILHPKAGEGTLKIIREHGGTVLHNTNAILSNGDSSIYIIGVDDPFTHSDDLSRAMEQVPGDAFKILLAHAPTIARKAVEMGIDIMLCGHTHGGQVRLPGIGAIYARTGFRRALSAGLYTGDRLASALGIQSAALTNIFISRGIGTSHLPIRLLCRPEIAVLRLRKTQ